MKKRRRQAVRSMTLLLAMVAVLAVIFYVEGGVHVRHSSQKNQSQIAETRETLSEMETRELPDIPEEQTIERTTVQDIEAEQNKILAIEPDAVDKAQLLQRFENTAIVGDSFTAGCTAYGYLNDTIVLAEVGASVGSSEELFQTVKNTKPSTIFLCFGLNDMKAYESDVARFIDHYTKCITDLQQALPNATIYVQALFPPKDGVTKSFFQYRELYNTSLQTMCNDLGTCYIDASFILENKPELYDQDGVHAIMDFYPMWLTYLGDIAGLSE